MARHAELKARVLRQDFFCEDCSKVTSVYGKKSGKFFCAWCGEMIAMVRYNTIKHGCISGYRHWTTEENKRLEAMLREYVTWEQVAAAFGRGRTAVRRQAERNGYEKAYKYVRQVFLWKR